jgi:hypothetical protein
MEKQQYATLGILSLAHYVMQSFCCSVFVVCVRIVE